jgi:hypothetical protein
MLCKLGGGESLFILYGNMILEKLIIRWSNSVDPNIKQKETSTWSYEFTKVTSQGIISYSGWPWSSLPGATKNANFIIMTHESILRYDA